jgi:hypothetical protein
MDIVRRLRRHALPDPHDEREVLHAPLLREAADEIDALRYSLRLDEELIGMIQKIISRINNRPMPNESTAQDKGNDHD